MVCIIQETKTKSFKEARSIRRVLRFPIDHSTRLAISYRSHLNWLGLSIWPRRGGLSIVSRLHSQGPTLANIRHIVKRPAPKAPAKCFRESENTSLPPPPLLYNQNTKHFPPYSSHKVTVGSAADAVQLLKDAIEALRSLPNVRCTEIKWCDINMKPAVFLKRSST